VRPLVDASLEVLGPMVFHGGRLDLALIAEMAEMLRPMLLEMGRLAIERCRPPDLVAIRRLRDVAADTTRGIEVRYAAIHELFVLLADMTRNRVWQMLARRLRALFRQEPVRAARARLRRDPGRFVPLIDTCLAALDRGRKAEATANLQELIRLLGDFSDVTQEPSRPRSKGATR
jgi:DNA-binding FadR family transcriptional regulator